METFFWFVGILLILLPVILALFSVFLMVTQKAVEPDLYDDGSWGQDVDQMAKNRYSSDI